MNEHTTEAMQRNIERGDMRKTGTKPNGTPILELTAKGYVRLPISGIVATIEEADKEKRDLTPDEIADIANLLMVAYLAVRP